MPTLQDRFAPRRNSFDLLRLSFALVVAVSHGIELHGGTQPRIGLAAPGTFGLDGFFILSGFLVTRSYLMLDSFPRFAWHRFLRIMPGFWACLLVLAFVAAPLAAILQGLSPAVAFTGEPSALRFVAVNAGLLIMQYDIAGILSENPSPYSFDGSLWTLVFEAFCYAIIGALGAAGLLARRRILVPIAIAVLLVLTAMQEFGLPVLVNDRVLRLVLVFLLGAVACLYADRIPMHWGIATGCLALFGVSLALFDDYRVLGAVPLAYLFLWFAVSFPWPWSMRADVSYGLYIYHWPVMQLLVLTAARDLPPAAFIALGVLVTLLPSALSWYLVEKPALGFKHSPLPDRLAQRVTGPPGRHRAKPGDTAPIWVPQQIRSVHATQPTIATRPGEPVHAVQTVQPVRRPAPASSHRPPARSI